MVAFRTSEVEKPIQARCNADQARHEDSRSAEPPKQSRIQHEHQRRRQLASRATREAFLEEKVFRYELANSYDSRSQFHIGLMADVRVYCVTLK
jgi:hypothetical protein